MTLDKNLFSNAQAITASAASTNELKFKAGSGNIGDGQSVRVYVQVVAPFDGQGAKEKTTFTAPTTAALTDGNGSVFRFFTPANGDFVANTYGAYFRIDGVDSPPTIAGATLVPIDVETGDDAATNAPKIVEALNALPDVNVSAVGTTITIENVRTGAVTDTADGNGSDDTNDTGISFTKATDGAAPSTLKVSLQDSPDGSTYEDVLAGETWTEDELVAGKVALEVTVPKHMRQYHQVYYTVGNGPFVHSAGVSSEISAGYMPVP